MRPGRRYIEWVAIGTVVATVTLVALIPGPAFAGGVPIAYYAGDAGYEVISTSVPPATASVEFNVPALSCTSSKSGVGFGLVVENASGSLRGSPTVGAACVKRKPVYTANINLNNTNTVLSTTIRAGDTISLSASQTPSLTSATFTDTTTGFSQTMTGTGATAQYGFIGSVPDQALTTPDKKVAKFAPFSFNDAEVNSAGIGSYTAATGLYEAVQTTKGHAPPKGKVEVEPGTLGTSSFPLDWVSAG